MTTPIIGIVGPTASGKTDLALALAERMPVEIVVADSRQVYRGMDVGTAKPGAVARASVPHHLLDLVDPDEPFTVAHWVARARELIPAIAERGNLPMIVAGTGLYMSALLDGHDYAVQPWSAEVRQRLTDALEAEGLDALIERLRSIDPLAATHLDLRNPRRVLRALERAEAGGGAVDPHADPYPGRMALIGLSRPREVLYQRIDDRAERIFAGGLLPEVATLLERGYAPQLRPLTSHGYAEAARHLAGEWSLDQAIDATARRTRQYAKRQLTWFRRDPRIMWLPAATLPANEPSLVADAERLVRSALA